MTKTRSPGAGAVSLIYVVLGIHRRGGMERAAYEVIDRLKARHTLIVVARECENVGVRHVPVKTPRRPALVEVTWYRWAARRALRRLCRGSRATVITTGIGASGGPVDVVIAQYCQEAYRRRFGAVRGGGFLGKWWQRLTLARFCADERAVYQSKQLKRVIAVSRGVGRELIECYGVDPAIIRHVPNGVDLSVFHPPADAAARRRLRVELGLPTDRFLACFVGGDWRRKGLQPAIESLGGLPDVDLVVVGAGDRAEFEAYAVAVGAAGRVHFVGKRANPELFLQASDVYLFPSAYEAFSLSCIEAAACGLPLVVTKINGTEELVTDGSNGFFVGRDRESIAAVLCRLRDDAALRVRLSAQAAVDAKHYNWDAIATAHEGVYQELDSQLHKSK